MKIVLHSVLFSCAVFASNASRVSSVVNSAPALAPIRATLTSLSPAETEAALNEMDPSLYKGSLIVQQNNSVIVRGSISERFQVLLDYAHCFNDESDKEPVYRSTHIWFGGLGDFFRQSNISLAQVGYRANTGGGIIGIDFQPIENLYVGALGAYTHSLLNWKETQGGGDLDTGYGGIYLFGSGLGHVVYFNSCVIGGWTNFNEHRKILYPGVNARANNSHRGEQLMVHLDAGVNMGIDGFTIRPFDGVDWIIERENSYQEHGAGIYNLNVKNSRANMIRNELGLNLAVCKCFRKLSSILDAKVSWVREVRINGQNSQSAFVIANASSFITEGYFPNRNLFSCAATLNLVSQSERWNSNLYAYGLYGKRYSDKGLGGQLTFGF